MNSTRVEEVAALRAQKKLDRKAEEDAALAKAEAKAKAREASIARIVKKMASIEALKNGGPNPAPAQELPPVETKPAAKKVATEKPAAKKVAKEKPVAKKVATTKPKAGVRSKGQKRKK